MTALSGNEVLTFGLRSGTRQGVESHTFRVETQRDLSTWSRAVVQTAHNAAVLIKEVSCSKCLFCQSSTVYQLLHEFIINKKIHKLSIGTKPSLFGGCGHMHPLSDPLRSRKCHVVSVCSVRAPLYINYYTNF